MSDFRLACLQSLLIIAFLAHQAWLMGDAIIRTLFRLFITRRDLLEWTPAAQAKIGREADDVAYYRWMAGAVLIGVAAPIVALALRRPDVAPCRPVCAFCGSPLPQSPGGSSLPSAKEAMPAPTAADARALRLIARRTWRFFETFVTT